MRALLHISDPHFGTERPQVVEALVRLSHQQSPDLVIVSGDMTQRARKPEFVAAAEFIESLRVPAHLVIPGNHDIPLFDVATRIFRPYARYARTFGVDLEPVHDAPKLLVVGVRTTRRYRHIEGQVSPEQIEQVAQRLRQAGEEQLRIVVTHQPVYVTHTTDEEHLLRGRERAIKEWAEAGADLILGGHIHRPFIRVVPEGLAGTGRAVWAIQAGTAVSSRTRNDSNNSINVIRYGFDGKPRYCVVERWDYAEGEEAFVMVESQEMGKCDERAAK